MVESISSKRLTLRAVLHDVNPMVIRVVEISDQLRLREFHDIFRTILGWEGDLGHISRRFVKRQSMQWTLRGAHLLLQTRTKVLNGELDELFRGWYPKFRPQPEETKPQRKAA